MREKNKEKLKVGEENDWERKQKVWWEKKKPVIIERLIQSGYADLNIKLYIDRYRWDLIHVDLCNC